MDRYWVDSETLQEVLTRARLREVHRARPLWERALECVCTVLRRWLAGGAM